MNCALRRGWLALTIPLVFTACDDDDLVSPTVVLERFSATLTGAAERPNPVTTTATGEFKVEVRDTGTVAGKRDTVAIVRYQLTTQNISNTTQAHIHAGTVDVAGPIMVFLYGGPTITGSFSGVLAQAEITRRSRFTAPFTFDSVMTRMRNGTAYANVHTSQNPAGEIRGQISATNDTFFF
jgi:hypothetical protein